VRRDAWIPTGPNDAPLRLIDLAGGRSSINQRKLRRDGLAGWQAATTAALLTAWDLTPKPGVFFDVGANAGVYALLCRLLWPSSRAVAFEPSPTTVTAGRRWAQTNDAELRFEQVAVSDRDDHGTLYLSSRSDASNSLISGFRPSSGTVDVELVTLDTYVERQGVAPTVVKIDVEQHEPAVVRGARRTLAEARPVVVMELLRTDASRRAHRQLVSLGYQPHRLGARDRLYWPDGLPPGWDERYDGWLRAVQRCTPRGPLAPLASGARSDARLPSRRRPARRV
jgi:FkbM family methyltransferase